MRMSFNTKPSMTIHSVYAPLSLHPEDVDDFYNTMHNEIRDARGRHINIVSGDFNTVICKPKNDAERNHWGSEVFNDQDYLDNLEPGYKLQIDQQKDKFLDFCSNKDLFVCNSIFTKPKEKLTTYTKEPSTPNNYPFTNERYSQLDYILINKKWKNATKNCESDITATIDENMDHFPVIASMEVRFKRNIIKQEQKNKSPYRGKQPPKSGKRSQER